MLLRDLMKKHGNFLFRWRSYLPLALLPLAIAAFPQAISLDRWLGKADFPYELVCLGISLSGLFVRGLTVGYAPAGTSGRNTKRHRAAVLNTTGLYSVTRNPIYLANFLVILGIVLAIKVWWLAIIVITAFALYYERIICAEEAFLEDKFGASYTEWVARTPVFFPDFRLWRTPELPFSTRTVLRREFHGFYLIAVAFVLVEFGEEMLAEGATLRGFIFEDSSWIMLLAVGTFIYVALMFLKKRTKVLLVAGR